MTTWNATTIAAGDYSALPTLPGVLVGFSYNESEAGRSAPAGTVWVPIQRDDEAATYESDEDAADAYARAVGSPEESTRGYALDGNADVFAADMFVAVPIGATIDARGVVELPASSPLATVCGGCGRGWLDEHTSDATPAQSGRCPFEYDHPNEDDEPDEEGTVAHAAAEGCTGAIERDGGLWVVVHEDDECPVHEPPPTGINANAAAYVRKVTDAIVAIDADDPTWCYVQSLVVAISGVPEYAVTWDSENASYVTVPHADEPRRIAAALALLVDVLVQDENWSADTLDRLAEVLTVNGYAEGRDGQFASTGRAEREAGIAPIR